MPKLKYFVCQASLIMLVVSGAGCGERQATSHPIAEGYPYAIDQAISLNQGEGDTAMAQLAELLRAAPRVATIGQLGGPPELQFGDISSIASDGRGRVFVLDRQAREIDAFTRDGEWLGLIAGPGPGPKELQRPVSITMVGIDTLLIADRASGMRLLDADPRDTFPVIEGWKVSPPPMAACWMDGTAYVRGDAAPGALQVRAYSGHGELMDSMLKGYGAGNPLVQSEVSEGTVACDERAHAIVAAYQLLPIVFGLSADGAVRWGSRIEGFVQAEISESTVDGAPAVTVGRSGEHVLHIVPFPGGASILQTVVTSEDSFPQLKSYVISSVSGQGFYIGDELPAIMAADSTHFYGAWGTETEPWPRLVVHEYRQP